MDRTVSSSEPTAPRHLPEKPPWRSTDRHEHACADSAGKLQRSESLSHHSKFTVLHAEAKGDEPSRGLVRAKPTGYGCHMGQMGFHTRKLSILQKSKCPEISGVVKRRLAIFKISLLVALNYLCFLSCALPVAPRPALLGNRPGS